MPFIIWYESGGGGGGSGRICCEAILADSSATDSSSANCCIRFAELGTWLDRGKYGDMSAVLAVRREPKDLIEAVGDAKAVAASVGGC
jgi:hypothetical protein